MEKIQPAITIDVFHDTACPWCRIGKQHLKLALAEWAGAPVSVGYRAFFLNPDMPPEGMDYRTYLLRKGNGQIPLEQWFGRPAEAGAAVGLTFNFEKIALAPKTLLSHRLLALAPAEKQEALLDAVYTAFFEDGQDIGDRAVLLDLAAAVGLDREEMASKLAGDEGLEQILNEVESARAMGVSGVPFFVLQGKYAFSGAQPPDVILNVLEQVSERERAAAGAPQPGTG